jgi:23S rRNA pseudouridine1911/1915/1917 synthase
MNEKRFQAEVEDIGKRLDVCLLEKLKYSYTRSQLKHFIDKGFVAVSGSTQKPNYHIKEKDLIEITLPIQQDSAIPPENIPIDIVYEDSDIIVLNKPSGMVVHPASGNTEHTLVNALLFHTNGQLAHIDGKRPGIVHRLDKDVSGLMVAAKTDFAYRFLVDSFKVKSVKRTYIAFVEGTLLNDKGCLELPIGRSSRDRKKMAVRFFNSKQALTSFVVLKRFTNYTKLCIQIQTGRTHQIRVHMSYIGHPVVGDIKYGGRAYSRIALYASELQLNHPTSGEKLSFKIDMPAQLKELDDA